MSTAAKKDSVVSAEFEINKRIDKQIEETTAGDFQTLPGEGHPLVEDYIRKIEGKYNVTRSKMDTDNAINLLYIAYNLTPQPEEGIRNTINGLMGRLISAQHDSATKMKHAVDAAGEILKSLNDRFGDWKEVRSEDDDSDLIDFLNPDMVDLAGDIEKRAERIAEELNTIAETYDGIIADTDTATNNTQTALAKNLDDKAALEQNINQSRSRAAGLESQIKGLQVSIQKYQSMANEYESRAKTAEERAFVMSIIRVGAEMLTSSIPAITAGIAGAATGGASLIASSAVSTANQMSTSDAATNPDDKTAEEIEKKKDVNAAKADKASAEKEKVELERKGEALKAAKGKVEGEENKSEDAKTTEVKTYDVRIKANEEAIKAEEKKISDAVIALEAAQNALQAISAGVKELSQEQKDQASSLRDMQIKMIEKVETYETARREQEKELIEIKTLLADKRSEQETIQLAIKSLNLSLRALKRMREIIVEISFFFKSFAEFMSYIARNSKDQGEAVQKYINREKKNPRLKRRIVKANNEFFVSQAAEWKATQIVSSKFVENFNDGWSELNKLNGKYLTDDALEPYMTTAADKIAEIEADREAASRAKIASLAGYKARIKAATNV